MNQNILSSLTVTLLVSTFAAPIAQAESPAAGRQESESVPELASRPSSERAIVSQPNASASEPVKLGHRAAPPTRTTVAQSVPSSVNAESRPEWMTTAPKVASSRRPTREVVKVGEQQTPTKPQDSITKIFSHEHEGRSAATLYVRNIPVLTFLGPTKSAPASVKVGTQSQPGSIAAVKSIAAESVVADQPNFDTFQDDPVWRAGAIAARINQLNRDSTDPTKITVNWDAEAGQDKFERYSIKTGDTVLAKIDTSTILPNTTRNLETDALEAANLLRRLLGNAAPLSQVAGKPRSPAVIAFGPVRFQINGIASWYGPGFTGNPSASGEIFDENALTAAHKTLPFGTRVLVTNLDNGQSVIVRINDRGPYAGDRVIDLSAGAARILGLINAGVAPVRLDILGQRIRG